MSTPIYLKVVCLWDAWKVENRWTRMWHWLRGRTGPDPIEGEIYTAIAIEYGCYYSLKEFPGDVYRMEGICTGSAELRRDLFHQSSGKSKRKFKLISSINTNTKK